ncbi:ATP-binding cassette domain-containing protein [Streptomyces sp. CBMA156]|uniref:ATP-binding cassette domain-containing protein n=1 Tax=Streptomyces sp. CBMA156 TaxID=1930280 RepID=UPI001661E899|nr:ATP-binding cassette domain-containing protein [Streptomyces sp. CBMA156]MBD0676647.1 daunorubicin/doxorubicin resistance ABC transporter ATP-binding protein DrrA [Streptomyces sp. CBMA156]
MSDTARAAIEMAGVEKRFGATEALRGLDLAVPAGTVCGLLGPNGAGKTTAVRVLATLAAPDRGTARVAGHDVVREAEDVRRAIGLAGQHAAVDEGITGRDNLHLFGRLHNLGARRARERADELLTRFGLADAADRLVRTYSGGMRRRLDLVASLVTSPSVLFLDEPTTGLDPRSRQAIWDTVRELADGGTTVLLTTQYLEEADRLADDIVVVDRGAAIATGPPAGLKAAIGSQVSVTLADPAQLAATAVVLSSLTGGDAQVDVAERTVTVLTAPGVPVLLPSLVRELDGMAVTARDVAVREPSLDDVFLALTREPADGPAAEGRAA